MSLHVLTPLDTHQVAAAIMRAIPMARVDVQGDSMIVTEGRNQVRVILETWGPLHTSFGVVQSRISFVSEVPLETECPLEKSMASEVRLAQAVRAAIKALKPMETMYGTGKVVPSGHL